MVQLTRLACVWSRKRLADEAGVLGSHVSRVESGILPLAGKALFEYARADIDPVLAIPELDPADYSAEHGEIAVAHVVRRLWRLSGPDPLENPGSF
ncbi:helix-turn-helix domain-containing protein [Mycobacterium syngnathidarum]|uniref:helix-turn-helix domain-containing protein n=1 Tax=Mycobacterium syngnathidarum TaxID=1908205 RepID=UPI001F61B6DB|nr:helix-turn-helix transcriptional regulator [Mycobacterium syngnathidarum]